MSSRKLVWLDLAQDPHDVNIFIFLIFSLFNNISQRFSLEFSLKADVQFEQQANSFLPILKLKSCCMMSELFRHGEDFDNVLKQLEVIFLDGVADHCAEENISWDPVPAIPQFGELAWNYDLVTIMRVETIPIDSTETDITTMDSDSMTNSDSISDSESEMWDQFNFPQLSQQEDKQLTIALQGGTPQPTTTIETSSTMPAGHQEATYVSSHIRSRVQGQTIQGSDDMNPSEIDSESLPISPPPYISDNSWPTPLINNHSITPFSSPSSSTHRQIYVVIDGVYHVIREV